jgi:hypothetical protein|tara:strand:- start:19042 stop:19203 length:162 start_codon:yes stop_codon:yes gene_type:complete
MGKKKDKKKLKKAKLRELPPTGKVKSKCCKKYKKSESKRCKKCPCFDLLKKVA